MVNCYNSCLGQVSGWFGGLGFGGETKLAIPSVGVCPAVTSLMNAVCCEHHSAAQLATALEADNVPYDEEKFVFANYNGELLSSPELRQFLASSAG